MPIFRSPESFNNIPHSGAEKRVYVDRNPKKDGSDLVLKINNDSSLGRFFYESTAEHVKAVYYLGKILHLLLPKNIPDIKSTKVYNIRKGNSFKNFESIHERKFFDKSAKTAFGSFADGDRKITASDLSEKIKGLGVGFDAFELEDPNYEIDDQTKDVIYVDTFVPVTLNSGQLQKTYDAVKLKEAIENLPDKTDQQHGLNYLMRLEALADQLIAAAKDDPNLIA